eukprot:1481680-Lingulodinium_polyedra.AAC.1
MRIGVDKSAEDTPWWGGRTAEAKPSVATDQELAQDQAAAATLEAAARAAAGSSSSAPADP